MNHPIGKQMRDLLQASDELCHAKVGLLNVDDVLIDESYQRKLDSKRVERLRRAYQRGACKAISVSRRSDGSLYVYDGQHTLALCRALGIKDVPAVVVNGTRQQEARWFLLMNGSGVSKATARESHKAAIEAGDPASTAVQELLRMYGVAVSSGGARKGETSAIGTLKTWAKSDVPRLSRAMGMISRIWANEDHAWTQIVLRAAWDVSSDADFLLKVEAGLKKRKVTPRRLLDTAAGMQASTGVPGGGSGYAKRAILQLAKVSE